MSTESSPAVAKQNNNPQQPEFMMASSLSYVLDAHTNVGQVVVTTTEDKIRLCLHDHLKRMESRQGWLAPTGVVLTILLTLITSDFKDKWGFKKETWQAFFMFCLLAAVVWLIWSLTRLGKRHTIDDVVTELKCEQRSLIAKGPLTPLK